MLFYIETSETALTFRANLTNIKKFKKSVDNRGYDVVYYISRRKRGVKSRSEAKAERTSEGEAVLEN